jgi:hypothetical protein
MPSYSKECLGGFVGFQRLAIDPNEKVCFPNFSPFRARKRPREFQEQIVIDGYA